MYLADLLNSKGLFHTVAGWQTSHADDEGLSDFLFRATSALIHLVRLNQLHTACVSEYQGFARQLDIRRDRIVFSSSSVFALVNEIPPLLATLRIMQNMLLPMCARALGLKTSVASSMNDAVPRLHTYLPPYDCPGHLTAYLLVLFAFWPSKAGYVVADGTGHHFPAERNRGIKARRGSLLGKRGSLFPA
jgi:hypothetical protein